MRDTDNGIDIIIEEFSNGPERHLNIIGRIITEQFRFTRKGPIEFFPVFEPRHMNPESPRIHRDVPFDPKRDARKAKNIEKILRKHARRVLRKTFTETVRETRKIPTGKTVFTLEHIEDNIYHVGLLLVGGAIISVASYLGMTAIFGSIHFLTGYGQSIMDLVNFLFGKALTFFLFAIPIGFPLLSLMMCFQPEARKETVEKTVLRVSEKRTDKIREARKHFHQCAARVMGIFLNREYGIRGDLKQNGIDPDNAGIAILTIAMRRIRKRNRKILNAIFGRDPEKYTRMYVESVLLESPFNLVATMKNIESIKSDSKFRKLMADERIEAPEDLIAAIVIAVRRIDEILKTVKYDPDIDFHMNGVMRHLKPVEVDINAVFEDECRRFIQEHKNITC